jgi:hypothetical protein
MLEWEKERKKEGVMGEIFLGTRIVSTKALEFYGLTKAIGFGAGKIIQGGKWAYSSLGGGMKIADLTVRGGSVSATLVPTTTSTATTTYTKIRSLRHERVQQTHLLQLN